MSVIDEIREEFSESKKNSLIAEALLSYCDKLVKDNRLDDAKFLLDCADYFINSADRHFKDAIKIRR